MLPEWDEPKLDEVEADCVGTNIHRILVLSVHRAGLFLCINITFIAQAQQLLESSHL